MLVNLQVKSWVENFKCSLDLLNLLKWFYKIKAIFKTVKVFKLFKPG